MATDIRIDEFAAQKRKRRLVVQLDVVKRIGEDFGRPYQTGLDVFDQEQLHGPEQHASDAEHEPDQRDVADKAGFVGSRRKQAEIGRIETKRQRRERPDRQQHDFAAQIVTNFYFFLVFVRGLVNYVVILRLEEEMPGLPRGHRDEPAG